MYLAGDVGPTYIRESRGSATDSNVHVGFTIAVGYRSGKFHGCAGMFVPDFGELDRAAGAMATAGFDLIAF